MAAVPESTPPAPPPAAHQKPRFVISRDGIHTKVEVDGVPVRWLVGVNVAFEPDFLPKLDLTLGPLSGVITLDDAQLTVDTANMPERVARALYEHLRAKYQRMDAEAAQLRPSETK